MKQGALGDLLGLVLVGCRRVGAAVILGAWWFLVGLTLGVTTAPVAWRGVTVCVAAIYRMVGSPQWVANSHRVVTAVWKVVDLLSGRVAPAL